MNENVKSRSMLYIYNNVNKYVMYLCQVSNSAKWLPFSAPLDDGRSCLFKVSTYLLVTIRPSKKVWIVTLYTIHYSSIPLYTIS